MRTRTCPLSRWCRSSNRTALSHSPLFQVMFTLQNNEQTVLSLPAITSTLSPLDRQPDRQVRPDHDLDGRGGRRSREIEYNTDLFDETTMRRLVGHYLRLLGEVVRDASQPVLELPLLTAGEQQLRDWNDWRRTRKVAVCKISLRSRQPAPAGRGRELFEPNVTL